MTTIGVLGGTWRATVRADGTIEPWAGGGTIDNRPLKWHVAADDRWHTPAESATIRQRRIEGVPVVETRMRIPSGDAVQRIYAVADHGGMTVVEVENDSPLPIAVAFEGPPLRSARPPTAVPIEGIDLAPGTTVFPVGHRATLRVALAHAGSASGALPPLPSAAQVERGWTAACARGGRLALPAVALVEAVTSERCEVLLRGPGDEHEDPAAFLIAVGELVRLGADVVPFLPEVAAAVHAVARGEQTWEQEAALGASARVLHAAGERRALRDLQRICERLPVAGRRPPVAPAGVRVVPWVEQMLVHDDVLLPAGIPEAWAGQQFEAHDLPIGLATTVSFAVRWHGERPAVLWETAGERVTLRSPVAAPGWSTEAPAGETLWPRYEVPASV